MPEVNPLNEITATERNYATALGDILAKRLRPDDLITYADDALNGLVELTDVIFHR